jgi:hypothetical protein
MATDKTASSAHVGDWIEARGVHGQPDAERSSSYSAATSTSTTACAGTSGTSRSCTRLMES